MSSDIVKAAVTPPPTKVELLQAAAQVIAEENKIANHKRADAIDKAQKAFEAGCRKAAAKLVNEAVKKASVDSYHRHGVGVTKWSVDVHIYVQIEGALAALKKAWDDAIATKKQCECPKEILKQLKARSAGHTPENIRITSILATPALRKAVKEFGEKLLAAPTAQEKAAAIEVGGAQ